MRAFLSAEEDYEVIFTGNASGALKLVGSRSRSLRATLPADLRQPQLGERHPRVRARQGRGRDVPARGCSRAAHGPGVVCEELAKPSPGGADLFAYPAQSNFSGVQHPLGWIGQAHAHGWDVILDAAAFAPTNRLDLPSSSPTSFPCRSTRCSGTRRGSARSSRGGPRCRSSAAMVRGRDDHARLGAR